MAQTYGTIGIISDIKTIDTGSVYSVGFGYIQALINTTNLVPIIIPALGNVHMHEFISKVDGLMLTGSISNVHPHLYGHNETTDHEPFDHSRDKTSLSFISSAIDIGMPIIGICRGLQELNVALGGTLHPAIHNIPNRLDHRMVENPDKHIRMSPRHNVHFPERGLFSDWMGSNELAVNSLHHQGIDCLSNQLQVEATAEDGTIEAIRLKNESTYVMGVQWHPEYKAKENNFSRIFYKKFEEAVMRFKNGDSGRN